jgi:hypothetical protein
MMMHGLANVKFSLFLFPLSLSLSLSPERDKIGKVQPCTGTEALYRPYGP